MTTIDPNREAWADAMYCMQWHQLTSGQQLIVNAALAHAASEEKKPTVAAREALVISSAQCTCPHAHSYKLRDGKCPSCYDATQSELAALRNQVRMYETALKRSSEFVRTNFPQLPPTPEARNE